MVLFGVAAPLDPGSCKCQLEHVKSLPLMGRGRGGVVEDVALDVRDHPLPTSPIEGEKQRGESDA
jgi:hypothetical protein